MTLGLPVFLDDLPDLCLVVATTPHTDDPRHTRETSPQLVLSAAKYHRLEESGEWSHVLQLVRLQIL